MSALEPGLYRAKVRGIPGESIVLVGRDDLAYSLAPDGDARQCYVFTDAHPLIVLDLGDRLRREYVLEILRAPRHGWTHDVADQIEAQCKPARIPEPGLWGVVEADGYRWMRFQATPGECWANAFGEGREWFEFTDDPTLIREGVAS